MTDSKPLVTLKAMTTRIALSSFAAASAVGRSRVSLSWWRWWDMPAPGAPFVTSIRP